MLAKTNMSLAKIELDFYVEDSIASILYDSTTQLQRTIAFSFFPLNLCFKNIAIGISIIMLSHYGLLLYRAIFRLNILILF